MTKRTKEIRGPEWNQAGYQAHLLLWGREGTRREGYYPQTPEDINRRIPSLARVIADLTDGAIRVPSVTVELLPRAIVIPEAMCVVENASGQYLLTDAIIPLGDVAELAFPPFFATVGIKPISIVHFSSLPGQTHVIYGNPY